MGNRPLETLPVGSPLYLTVKAHILNAIEQGQWQQGEAIPSETKLSKQFDISIGTLRRAIDELVQDNILVRHQGRGTYVNSRETRSYQQAFGRLIGARDQMLSSSPPQGHNIQLMAVSACKASAAEADALSIGLGSKVSRLKLLHTVGGEVAAFEDIALPGRIFEDVAPHMVNGTQGDIYQMYQDVFNTTIVKVYDAVSCELMNETMAKVFETEKTQPVLIRTRVAWSNNDHPVEYRTTWIDPRRMAFGAETRG